MRLKIPFFVIFFAMTIIKSPPVWSQGLKFTGMDFPIDRRSSYAVFNDASVMFRDSLAISFEFCSMPPSEFGYILRIKNARNKKMSWNMSYDGTGEGVIIRLNEEGYNSLIKAELSHSEIQPMRWTKISVKFDMTRDSVYLSIGDKKYANYSENMKKDLHAKIYFGKSDYFIDVPTFAIRDLNISGAYAPNIHFPFNESSGNKVHDDNGRFTGTVSNPQWLFQESLQWKNIAEITIAGNSGTAWNPAREEIYVYNNDEIVILNVITNNVTRVGFSKPCPVFLNTGSSFVDRSGKYLFSYEARNAVGSQMSTMTAKLDLDTYEWTPLGNEQLPMPLFHHCSFFNPVTHRYTVFGGFGNALYSGSYFSLDENGRWQRIWETYDGDKIFPRYFASAGVNGDNGDIFIYGGMGNESGEQIVGRHYYYDLHRIDPSTGESSLLWELDFDDENIVPVSELTVLGDYFYTLCYPEYQSKSVLSLYRFGIDDGQYKKYDAQIHMDSDRMHTHADLYFDEPIQRFFALTYEAVPGNESNKLTVYSMAFPPMNAIDLPSAGNACRRILPGILLIVTVIGTTVVILFRKHKAESGKSGNISLNLNQKHFSIPDKANAIYLFGDFCAKDKNDRDISYLFSPKLRQLFCLILQFSTKGGISSKRMSKILWPEKEENKAKNSRNVSINHLRKVLEQFYDINLVFENGRYRFETGERFYCDCIDYMTNGSDILGISSRGRFLKFQNEPIFDEFKSSVEGKVIPELYDRIQSLFTERKYPEVIEVASMLFDIDPLDETALSYQIKALRKLHLHQEATIRIAEFAAEHKKVNGTDFRKGM